MGPCCIVKAEGWLCLVSRGVTDIPRLQDQVPLVYRPILTPGSTAVSLGGVFVRWTENRRETSTSQWDAGCSDRGFAATGRRPSSIQCTMAQIAWQPVSSEALLSQPDGIWIIDDQGRTVFANDSMARILGTTTADLSGQDSFQYIFPEDLPEAQRLFASKQAGSSAPFHFKLRRADGSSIWVDVQGTPMHNAAGDFLGIVGTFTLSSVEE